MSQKERQERSPLPSKVSVPTGVRATRASQEHAIAAHRRSSETKAWSGAPVRGGSARSTRADFDGRDSGWSKLAIAAMTKNDEADLENVFNNGGDINATMDENYEYGGIHFGHRHGHKKYGPLLSHQK